MMFIVNVIMRMTVGVAIVWFFAFINRLLGKAIFQTLFFKNENEMPTTNFLLPSDTTLSPSMKKAIRDKLKNDFNIDLPSARDEAKNIDKSRKQIIYAVSQMRNSTRGNELLLQHNYEYGFIRNLLGGSIVAFLVCIFNLYFFRNININTTGFNLSLGLGISYLLLLLLSKPLTEMLGRNYAKVLFEQYLHH
ncbi:hypothetical protein [Chitinophaga flava]|nr:hypothetical protein [Chitinophaga flava]